jgi:type IV pilus assembly protein PilW
VTARADRSRTPGGFTLIELMIAMTLGLLLVLIIAQVFLDSKAAYTSIEELSRVQENARFTMNQMGRIVRMAGYVTNPVDYANRATIFPPTAPALDALDGGGNVPDTVIVRMQGSGAGTADGSVLDCQGNEIAGGNLSVNKYYLATGSNGLTNSLFCDITGSTIVPVAPAQPVELVQNVDDLQVLYGEDTDGDLSANRYVNKSGVSNMDNVVAVRIAALFESNDAAASANDGKTYALLDASYGPINDRRMRRIYTTTITLRNRAQ